MSVRYTRKQERPSVLLTVKTSIHVDQKRYVLLLLCTVYVHHVLESSHVKKIPAMPPAVIPATSVRYMRKQELPSVLLTVKNSIRVDHKRHASSILCTVSLHPVQESFLVKLPAQKEWNGIHVVVHVLAHVLTMTKFLVVHESVCVVVSVLKGLFLMMKRSVYQSQIALVISLHVPILTVPLDMPVKSMNQQMRHIVNRYAHNHMSLHSVEWGLIAP